ncbi:hypothetical protein VaNZ11_007490, partial [Volvox africanus]
MAPKPKVADLEAKLKAKEADLEAAQSALVKAEASRAKLKQYLEAFREQAISTTEIINRFKNLQQDYDSLQEKYQQLQQERKHPPTAATETGALPHDEGAGASGPDLAVASLEERLREEQQRGQQLQERCARLQEEQQAAVREAEQLRREHQQQLQSQGVSGSAAGSKKQQDIQQSVQKLLQQLQQEQRLNSELRNQLESALQQQQLLQLQAGESPVGGSAAAPRVGVAASSLPLGEAGKAPATTGVAAAVAHTQAIARKTAGGTSATTASRRRRVGGDDTSAVGSAAGSAAITSGSDSDSGGDGTRRCDGGGNLGRASRGQHRREWEIAAAQSRWKAAEAALEVTRREVEELRRREAAQKIEMDQLQAQLQALQALVSEHAAALKRQSVHLQQHDANLQRHELQLERHGSELQRHDSHMRECNNHLQRHGLQLEQHRDELQHQRHELVNVREGHSAETAAVWGQLEGVVAQLRGIHRTHSILRLAFGSSDAGCSAGDGSVDDHGCPGTGALNDASGQPNAGRLLPAPRAACRDGFGAPQAVRGETGAAAAVCAGPFSKKELLPQTQRVIQVAIDGGVAAPPGAPSEDDKAGGEQEQAEHHRCKRRRLEESDVATKGHADAVGMQPGRVVAKEYLPQQQQQQGQQQQHQGPTVHAHAVTVALRSDVVDASAEGKDLKRPAAAAPAGDACGETPTHRQGRGRPRKERTPSELLSTLLDGKATGAGNLTKVAAATARRAAAAIQANTLQPMPLASAICSAILRCSRDLVGVTAAANADSGTVLPPPLATAVDGLTTNTARSERGSGSRARGAVAAAAALGGSGGFLSLLLPSGRSRGHGGPGAATATAAGFGAVTLSDALTCLWCEPVEQQRQLVKWLLQVVGDTDRILGDEMTVGRGNGDSAAAVRAAVETQGGDGSDGVEALRKLPSSHASLRAAADASPLATVGSTGGTEIGAAAAVVEAEAREQPRSLQVSETSPSKEPMALLGSLVAQQLNTVACYPLEDGSPSAEAGEAADGDGLQGTVFVHGGGNGGAGEMPQGGGKGTEAVMGGTGAGGATRAPSLAQRCAAAYALGQLFRMYRDREGYQSTALELLHVTANACISNAPFNSGTTTAIAANRGCGQQPAIPASCPSEAVTTSRPTAHQTTGACADCSLVPLCCLLVGWPQALSSPLLSTSALPAQVQADSQISPARAETAAPPDHADVSERRPPLPISTDLGAAQGPRVGAPHAHVATGGRKAGGGLYEGPDDDRDILEDLFGDVESEAPHLPPRMGSDLQEMADASVWADPAWEAQLVLEPLGMAIATCGQLLALERLVECCIGGSTSMCSSIEGAAGCTDANSNGLQPTVTTSTVPHQSSSGSVLNGRLGSPVALDGHAEAVAAAVLLRALWEQHQQPPKGPGDQKPVGLLLPGVEEVLIAVGAIQTAMSSAAAVTAIEATREKGCRGSTDATVGLQSLANTRGFSKCRGGVGVGVEVGGKGRGSVGVDEDPSAVLAAALARAHFAISELASRLMGLLLTVMMERQQLRSRRHAHIEMQRQQEQQRYPPVDRAPGEEPSAAAAHCPSGSPEGPSHSRVLSTLMPPSGGAEAAYVANLRQALLLTCHLLPHEQVYDRVLRQLALWLYPGGPVAISSAVGSQQRKRSHEAVLLATATATATAMAGGLLADGNDGPAAAADTAASAAGSPLMVLGMEAADVPVWTARPRSGLPLPTADGTVATVDAASAARVAVGRALPCPEACSLDLETVRLVLEVIKDIACQVLGCSANYHGREQPFVPASPSASPSPSAPSPVPTTGSGTNAALQALLVSLACSSLCESLAGLLPALLQREMWGEDLVAAD